MAEQFAGVGFGFESVECGGPSGIVEPIGLVTGGSFARRGQKRRYGLEECDRLGHCEVFEEGDAGVDEFGRVESQARGDAIVHELRAELVEESEVGTGLGEFGPVACGEVDRLLKDVVVDDRSRLAVLGTATAGDVNEFQPSGVGKQLGHRVSVQAATGDDPGPDVANRMGGVGAERRPHGLEPVGFFDYGGSGVGTSREVGGGSLWVHSAAPRAAWSVM